MQNSENVVLPEELNPFIQISKNNPKKFIISRWLLFSVVICILTVIVSKVAPLQLDQLVTSGSAEMQEFEDLDLSTLTTDPQIGTFMIVIQGIIAFFTPIVTILLASIGLKLLTFIFKPIFNGTINMSSIILVTTMAYTAIFISTVIRLGLSIFQGEFITHSLGSLAFYVGDYSNTLLLNIIMNIDIFTIVFITILIFGLFSFSNKGKLIPTFTLLFSIYLIFLVGGAALSTI